jgi:hypothetical protein
VILKVACQVEEEEEEDAFKVACQVKKEEEEEEKK